MDRRAPIDSGAMLASAELDGRQILAVAAESWRRGIPACPGWDGADLVRHCGSVLGWAAAVVTAGERLKRRDLEAPPESDDALHSWYLDALDRNLTILGEADPESATWTFSASGDRRVAWWQRRMACELAVHRFDVERSKAKEDPRPVDGLVATAGIEEFMSDFLPGLIAAADPAMSGTLHLHATDGAVEWWVNMSDAGSARPEHVKADTALRATRSELLLWLWNRVPGNSLDVIGDSTITSRWAETAL